MELSNFYEVIRLAHKKCIDKFSSKLVGLSNSIQLKISLNHIFKRKSMKKRFSKKLTKTLVTHLTIHRSDPKWIDGGAIKAASAPI